MRRARPVRHPSAQHQRAQQSRESPIVFTVPVGVPPVGVHEPVARDAVSLMASIPDGAWQLVSEKLDGTSPKQLALPCSS